MNPRGPVGHPLSRRAPWSWLGHPGLCKEGALKYKGGYFSGTNLLDLVAPLPGLPCLTILLVIANSPK